MKRLLNVIAGILLLSSQVQSQESYTDKRNEINIGFFNAFELSNFSDLGIGYKRIVHGGAWRTGTGLSFSHNVSNYNVNINGYVQTNTTYGISPRIGYEFHQYFNRLQLQYGTDIVADISRSTLEDVSENTGYSYYQDQKNNKFSIRPFLGLKVFITKTISLSTETFLDIGYSYDTIERTEDGDTSNWTEKGPSMYLGPLGVFSINFHL